MDTRAGTAQGYAEGAFGPSGRTTPIPAGGELAVQVAGLGGVPAAATAVVMNVTGSRPDEQHVPHRVPRRAEPAPRVEPQPKAGQTVANLVVVPVGPGRGGPLLQRAGNTHLVVDVVGWFQPDVGAGYVALDPPTRDLDTRTGTGLRRAPWARTARTSSRWRATTASPPTPPP